MSGTLRRLAALALGVALLAACGPGAASAPAPSGPVVSNIAVSSRLLDRSGSTDLPEVGQPAPNFEFTMADGTVRKLSDLRGTPVIVNFWATWCGPCRAEMPDLQRTQREAGTGLVVLGVNKLELVDKIQSFAQELNITFPLIANPDGDISERYAAKNIPISFFIRADGTVGARHFGVMRYESIQQELAKVR